MCVDRPLGSGPQPRRQVMLGVVVDAQVQVEARWHLIHLIRPEVDHLDHRGEGAEAVDPRGIGPGPVVEDQGDAVEIHGSRTLKGKPEMGPRKSRNYTDRHGASITPEKVRREWNGT